jgi:hypothetical protein
MLQRWILAQSILMVSRVIDWFLHLTDCLLSLGSPYTLAACQSHLSSGVLGSRITWVEADPVLFLESHPEEKYDFVVFVHCIWYFASPTTLEATFRALRSHATHVIIAEWALSASSPNATPHVLAAFAQASLHNQQPSTGNIRTLLSPEAIKNLGMRCGLAMLEEHTIIPAPDLQDARWEVSEVTSEEFSKRLKAVEVEQDRCLLYALRDAVVSSMGNLTVKGERVHGMDVWTGIFHFI